MTRADWQYIPTDALDDVKRRDEAAAWGASQRALLASQWAADQGAEAAELGERYGVSGAPDYPGQLPDDGAIRAPLGPGRPVEAPGVPSAQPETDPTGGLIGRAARAVGDQVASAAADRRTFLERGAALVEARARGASVSDADLADGLALGEQHAVLSGEPLRAVGRTQAARAAGSVIERLEAAITRGGRRRNLSEVVEDVRVGAVRLFTDRDVSMGLLESEARAALGRDLTPAESPALMARLNADRGAEVAVQQGLRPILREVGADRLKLSIWLTLEDSAVAPAVGADGLDPAAAARALADLADELGPERAARVQDAARAARGFAAQLDQRRADAGLPPDPRGALLRDVDERTPGDPLAHLIGRAYGTEDAARRNERFSALARLADAHPDLRSTARPVPLEHELPRGSGRRVIRGWVDGEERALSVPADVGATIDQDPSPAIPGFSTVMGVVRALITTRNPMFLTSNATLDALGYLGRTATREGGPTHIPGAAIDLGRAYIDAFRGLLTGTFEGEASKRFLRQGGGMFGFSGSDATRRQTLDDLARSHALEVRHPRDIGRLVKSVLLLEPVEAVGERIELAPRVAAMRRAEKRGLDPQRATVEGRSVTLDFAQAGTFVRALNSNVALFLNASVQGALVPARAYRENPRGFLGTMATMLVAPVIAAEAWNRSDPERARDYDDVPASIKDSGLVLMLPTTAPRDRAGDRRPPFAFIRAREWAPFVVWTREVAARALGADPRAWQELTGATARGAAPIQADNPGDALESFGLPIYATARQLATDRDSFRSAPIATTRRDATAAPLSATIVSGLTAALEAAGFGVEVRPSQIDFALKDTTGGVGQMVLGADELRREGVPESDRLADAPLVGGIARRFVRDDIGDRLDRARDSRLSDQAREVLRAGGVRYVPGPVDDELLDVPLSREDRATYQALANERVDVAIRALATVDEWDDATPAERTAMVRVAVAEARRQTGQEMAQRLEITPTPRPTVAGATPTRTPRSTPTPTPDLAVGVVRRSPTPTPTPTPRDPTVVAADEALRARRAARRTPATR